MKLLCSVLILAGVFALNDASLSYEDEMRIANDQLMLEELKNMAMNRDVDSRKCSSQLIESMTATLDIYNNALSACNQTKQEALAAIEEAAKKTLLDLDNAIQGTCESLNKCSSMMDDPLDSLGCFEEESSQSAKVCTSVSNQASSGKIEMRTQIENCEGNEDICKSKCFSEYSKSSDKNNQDFADCMNGKESDGENPTTTTTRAPEGVPTEPSDEEESKDEESKDEEPKEEENRRRRPKMASNKHWRF